MDVQLLEQVRHESGLSQSELAALAGTSRTTLSAYERGRKSPTLVTVQRVLDRVGYDLTYEARVRFAEHVLRRGRPIFVADRLWRLPVADAFTSVRLPLQLNWSKAGATFDLADRRERGRCYEIVLREGMPADIRKYVDGALLVDLWSELVLPREVRAAWQPVIGRRCVVSGLTQFQAEVAQLFFSTPRAHRVLVGGRRGTPRLRPG